MKHIKLYNHWSLNERVKEVSVFGEKSDCQQYYYMKGVLLCISSDMKDFNCEELKSKFREIGFNFDTELDQSLEDEKLGVFDSSGVFFSFLTRFLPNQPGVICFYFGNNGVIELTPNKNYHYENSPLLHKLLTFLKSKGMTLVRRLDKHEPVTIDVYLDELGATKGVRLPEFYYHGTGSQHLENILRNGIAPNKVASNHNIHHEKCVFITTQQHTAQEYALNAANNAFRAVKNAEAYTDHEPVVIKIASKYLDMARMGVDYDLYIHFMRNNTIPAYDAAIQGRIERGTLVDMKTSVRDNINPALFYKVSYKGAILPLAFASVIYYGKEMSIAEARVKILNK